MRTIIVVGGSSGIGKSFVELEKENCKIIAIQRTSCNIEHGNITEYLLDVLKDELPEVEAIDGLLYCPGSINLKPFERLSESDFKNDFDINVMGLVRVLHKYVPMLKKGVDPSVLLFSSVAVKLGMPFHASVAAAKGAVEGIVKSLAAEYAPKIRFNAIAPTLTNTSLAAKILRNERSKEMSAERHPLKKYLEPHEVADLASFILSKKGASFSGQVIEMDCGIVNLKI